MEHRRYCATYPVRLQSVIVDFLDQLAVLILGPGRCGRDFITLSSTGSCYATCLSAVSFFRLADEVTERWLAEDCPGKRLPGDDVDRGKWVEELRVKPDTTENPTYGRRSS
jgi:hypothetical protein